MKKIFLMAAAVVALTACQNQTKTESESAEASVVVVEDPVPTVKEVEINVDTVGYTTTASGLRYKAIKEGTGIKPSATDEVTVHYTGKLLDGTKFDSSLDRGEPTSFPLDRVIKGWTEGLQLMAEGAKYQFIIPSDLAYGPRGAGEQIGPNATLYFEVELIKVKK